MQDKIASSSSQAKTKVSMRSPRDLDAEWASQLTYHEQDFRDKTVGDGLICLAAPLTDTSPPGPGKRRSLQRISVPNLAALLDKNPAPFPASLPNTSPTETSLSEKRALEISVLPSKVL